MSEIVFFLEEPSAKSMLEGLLPRILPDGVRPRYIVFEGKQDLEKQMVRRMRWYSVLNAKFVLLCDQDSWDCKKLKKSLVNKCDEAEKPALVRIACRELESWYLADLSAVERGMNVRGLVGLQNKNPYRSPDGVNHPDALLEKITKKGYKKISWSRAIGPHLDLKNGRSRSFLNFVTGVRSLTVPPSKKSP